MTEAGKLAWPAVLGSGLIMTAIIVGWACRHDLAVDPPRLKKLIYYGWGAPDTLYVRDHWREMEDAPFDGVGIIVAIDREAAERGRVDGGHQLGRYVMGQRKFEAREFQEAIGDLQTARWRKFTENFLPVVLSSARSAADVSWFDDARWDVIAHNFGVVARIAAEGRARGLILDPEHYDCQLFSYRAQRKRVDRSFAQYLDIARVRGRQVMSAIDAFLPDAVLLALFGNTLPMNNLTGGGTVEQAEYALLPAFYDGIVERMSPQARLVDGCEFAYGFKERRQFIEAYRRMHEDAPKLSAVPDRYRSKVGAGFGLWLDYQRGLDHFTPREFTDALRHALAVSDRYVWIYSEGPRFFPRGGVPAAYLKAITDAHRGVEN